jgi:hypothetical protein
VLASFLYKLISRLGALTEAGTPAATAHELEGAKRAVAQGVAPVSSSMPDALKASVTAGSHQAFVNGFPHRADRHRRAVRPRRARRSAGRTTQPRTVDVPAAHRPSRPQALPGELAVDVTAALSSHDEHGVPLDYWVRMLTCGFRRPRNTS